MNELISEAAYILGVIKRPMHYELLYGMIRERGKVKLKPSPSKPPSYELYAALYFEMKDPDTEFVKVTRGVYALKQYAGEPYTEVARKPRGEGFPVARKPKEEFKLKEGEVARCGNCRFLDKTESDLIHNDGGTCDVYEKSGRGAVAAVREACPHWEIRTIQQKMFDQSERDRIKTLILAANVQFVNFNGRSKSNGNAR